MILTSFLTLNLQMEKMLETISAIKNNKLRAKEDSVQNTRVKKWLQKVISQLVITRHDT